MYFYVSEIMENSDYEFIEQMANMWELPAAEIRKLDPFRFGKEYDN